MISLPIDLTACGFWHKTDIAVVLVNVGFRAKSGHWNLR
jgi:hypothetical protein